MSQKNLAWLIVVPAVVLFTGVMTYTAPPPEQDYKNVRTLVDVIAEVDKSYYRELTDDEKKKLMEDMVNGGLKGLDPYSQYYNEEQLKQFTQDNKGTFGGIGVTLGVDPKTDELTLDSVLPDGPAAEKLRAGDVILKVNGEAIDPTRSDPRGKIKGDPGTDVTLTVRRAGVKEPFEVTVTRQVIQIHPVKGVRRVPKPNDPSKWDWDYMADPDAKIAMIRLTDFTGVSADEMKAALKACEAAGARGLIIDLRNNLGGLLDQAEKIADLFLAEGHIVRTRDRHDHGRDLKAGKDGTVWEDRAKMPVAVLINGDSASAAEIVAAALQDNGRAVVVGERSYGKGSVQKTFPLDGGKASVKLTSEIWLTPSGKHIQKKPNAKPEDEWGVRPDAGYEVKMTDDQFVQMILHQRAAEVVRDKPTDPEPKTDPPKEPPADPAKPKRPELPKLDPTFKDPVVEKALEHLRKQATARRLQAGGPA
jgi:carboxyl-terminal processing protease